MIPNIFYFLFFNFYIMTNFLIGRVAAESED